MVTLRMVCIAVALLLALPVGFVLADHAIDHVTVDGGEVVNFALHELAEVNDIELLDPPPQYAAVPISNVPEQLVEGHSVFAVIDIPLVENVTEGTVEIVGDVECHTESNITYEEWGPGLKWPTRIDELHEECTIGGQVYATPDPFVDSQANGASMSPLQATGRSFPFTAPSGEDAVATEYSFVVGTTDWLGETTYTTYYAWGAPVLEPWLDAHGDRKSYMCPIPEDKLLEMGITGFQVLHESEIDPALLPQ